MEKNYCAVNTKYYKNSSSSGEIGHVDRLFAKDENAFADLKSDNFGLSFSDFKDQDGNSENLSNYYNRRLNDAKLANPKAIQKNSTTYIDSVLIFDNELMEKVLSEPNGKDKIKNSVSDFMKDFKKQYGYEPIGFNFHCDEGTFYNQKQFEEIEDDDLKNRLKKTTHPDTGEDGYLKRNLHAHAIFLNFDFEKNKSCHRNMKKEDWRDSQDLLHKHFEKYGFDRGEPKLTNDKDHLTKEQIIKNLNKDLKSLKRDNLTKQMEMTDFVDDMIDELEDGINKIDRFEKLQKSSSELFKKYSESPSFLKVSDFIKSKAPKVFKVIEKDFKNIMNVLFPDGEPAPLKNKLELEPEKVKKEVLKKIEETRENLIETVISADDELLEELKTKTEITQKEQTKKINDIKNRRKNGRNKIK